MNARPLWLSLIYALAALSFAFLCFSGGWRVWQVGGALKGTIGNIDKLAQTATKTAEETRLAASRFNEPERVARFDDYLVKQAASALANTQNTRRIGANLNTAIKEDLRPLLQDLRPRLNATIDTLNAQIAANGDRAQALMLEGENTIKEVRFVVADNRENFQRAVNSLAQAGYNAEVIMDKDHLGKASLELANNLENTAGATQSFENTMKDLENLSAAKIRPLYEPQKRGFWGKVLNGFNTAVKFTRGASTIIVLAGQF